MSEEFEPTTKRRAFVESTVKATNDEAREVLHLITNATVDRAGDIVEPAGVQLDNFLKNPVVLVDHDYQTEKIVGKAVSISVEEDGIYARTQFRDTPLAQSAYKLAKEGIGGWSIGFRPIEHESVKDEKGVTRGFRFKRWELLEYSLVAIPMNPDVVQNCVTRGLCSADQVPNFFKVADPDPPSEQAPPQAKADPETQKRMEAVRAALSRGLARMSRADAAHQLRKIQRGRD